MCVIYEGKIHFVSPHIIYQAGECATLAQVYLIPPSYFYKFIKLKLLKSKEW